MANENPYKSPHTSTNHFKQSTVPFRWFTPTLLIAATIASIPFYGYFVHAARDSQLTALVIFLCWILTWFFAIGSTAVALLRKSHSITSRSTQILLIVYLWIAGAVGWGGVKHAFLELIAG